MSKLRAIVGTLCVGALATLSGCPSDGGPTDGGVLSGRWTTESASEIFGNTGAFETSKITYTFEGSDGVTVEVLSSIVKGAVETERQWLFDGTFSATPVDGPESEGKAFKAGAIVFTANTTKEPTRAEHEAFLRAENPEADSEEIDAAATSEVENSTRLARAALLGCGQEGGCEIAYSYEPHFDTLTIGALTLFRE